MEMAPAAAVLGLDPEEMTLDQAVFAQLAQEAGLGNGEGMGRFGGRGGGRPGGQQAASSPSTDPGSQAPPAAARNPQDGSSEPSAGMSARRAMMDTLRAQVERGEISPDSLDAIRAGFRARMAEGQTGGMPGGMIAEDNLATAGMVNTSTMPRAGIAFVLLPDSTLEMRPILMGVNDWDNTEVLAGLREGDQVALIGAAQLQAEQEQMMNRMRGMGGMFRGMGRR
jgi:hypothetical protein